MFIEARIATRRVSALDAPRLREAALVLARIAELDESSNPRVETRGQPATSSRPAEAEPTGAAPEEGAALESGADAGEAAAPDADDVEFVKERLLQGRLFRRYGLADLARGQLADLLARFPANVEARRELRDLLQEVGRHEEAAEQQRALAALEGGGQEQMGDLEGLGVLVSAEEAGEAPVFDIALEALPGEEEPAGVDGTHIWIDLGDLAGPTRPSEAVTADEDEWARAGREIRSLVDGQVGRDDYETRYDLGIAYREMGLLDEAIAELQLASRSPSRLVECASLLAACFLDKALPQLAIKWLERGLPHPPSTPSRP